MLDTNVWSRLYDERAGDELAEFIRSDGHRAILPPSILLEVMRTRNPSVRVGILATMLLPPREQLTSEASLEAAEVVAEVRRLHPEWMRSIPDTARVASLNAWWSRGVWRVATSRPDALAAEVQRDWRMGSSKIIYDDQRGNRLRMIDDKFDVSGLDIWAEPPADAPEEYLAGWERGRRVQAWRAQCRDLFWRELRVLPGRAVVTKEDTTYADWVGSHVDLRRFTQDRHAFTRFWLEEVSQDAMPRTWLRWACEMAQHTVKVTVGNAYDGQHVAYLPDCDVFLTEDRRYAEVLDVVLKAAPMDVCRTHLIQRSDDEPMIQAVKAAIQTEST